MEEHLVSQSMLKDLAEYKKGEFCGLLFDNKWINHQLGKGSKANELGHYFEYLCTGALAKGETTPPQAVFKNNGDLATDYLIAQQQATYFKEVIHTYGIEIVSAGEKVIIDDWVGTLDIHAKWDSLITKYEFEPDPSNPENIVIIDLKFSALLEDKWSPFGWHIDFIEKKEKIMIQAKHYKFLFWKKYGFNPRFFFFIFDSKNVRVCKVYEVEIDTTSLELYEDFLKRAKVVLDAELQVGFKPIPKYEYCMECDYNRWCSHKVEVPSIITIKPQ